MTVASKLTSKDFQSSQETRWCPGCGDYSILAQFQRAAPSFGVPKEKIVVVSGIGCAARFPYYMSTYGVHSIHGRAPAVATGIKAMNPDLMVWVITGDGDALSIGGNHLMHALRRNVDLKIVLFNNRVYGLTKGQYSPTSPVGMRSSSTPVGSIDFPVDPVRFALGAGATFVARTVDVDAKHLQSMFQRAAAHKGAAFIEVLQNCPIFNDGAFVQLQDKKQRPESALYLEHGQPLVFGEGETKAITLDASLRTKIADRHGAEPFVFDEANEMHAQVVANIAPPDGPTPLGVIRAVERPTYDEAFVTQVNTEKERLAGKSLQALLESGPTWRVSEGTRSIRPGGE